MGKIVTAFADRKGVLFSNPESTTVSDLCALLGNLSVARAVLGHRAEIEEIFAEHDEMLLRTRDQDQIARAVSAP